MRACGCPDGGVVPPDREDDHRRYHDLVEQQTGIRYGEELNAATIQRARGMVGAAPSTGRIDARNERAGKSSPGWRREANRRQPATKAHARTGDPSTSHAAAASLPAGQLRASQEEVLALLRRIGPSTDETIAAAAAEAGIRQSPSGLRTRRAELVDVDLVRDTGRREPLASGRLSVVWVARPAG